VDLELLTGLSRDVKILSGQCKKININ